MRGYVRQRGKGVYQLRVEAGPDPATGKRRQVWRTVKGTRRAADEALAQLLVEVGQGQHAGADRTVSQLLDAWLRSAELSPTTRRDYGYAVASHVPAWLAGEKVWRVRAHHLDRLYADLAAAGVGPARVRRVHNIIHRAYRQAVRWQWVARNPATDATPPAVRRPDVRPPSPDELLRIIDHAAPELRVWLRLDASLGARRGEMCALRWSDVDLDLGEVTVARTLIDGGPGVGVVEKPTKTGKAGKVAVDAATAALLRSYRDLCAERARACGVSLPAGGFVFSREPDGSVPWRPDSVNRPFVRACKAAGVSGVRPHDLRHFVATQMLAAGVDVRTVSGRLRHDRTSTTLDMYAHFIPAKDREAADLLGRILENPDDFPRS